MSPGVLHTLLKVIAVSRITGFQIARIASASAGVAGRISMPRHTAAARAAKRPAAAGRALSGPGAVVPCRGALDSGKS